MSSHTKAALFTILAIACVASPTNAQMNGETATAAPFGAPVDDEHVFYHTILNEFEGRFGNDGGFRWEGEAWAGTDTNRILLRSEGEAMRGNIQDGQQELFYSRPISAFFDAQVGARYDLDSRAGRGWFAFGVEGLAPLFFHVGATGYASDTGHFGAKLAGSYDQLLSQRLILQPQMEINLYTKNDPARLTGSGVSEIDAGLRLRYELRRDFAPYIGVIYVSKFGHSATIAKAAGEASNGIRFGVGLRLWL